MENLYFTKLKRCLSVHFVGWWAPVQRFHEDSLNLQSEFGGPMNFKYPHSDHPPKPPAIKKKKKKAYCLLQNPISTSSIPSPIYYLCLFLKHLHLGKSLVTYTIDVAFWENYFHRLWKSCRRKSVCPGFNIIAGWQVKKAMMMGRMTPQLLVNEWLSFQVPFEASLCFFPFLSSLFHLPKDMLNEVRSDTSDNFSIHTKIKAPVTFEWHGSFMDPFLPCFIPLAEWLRAAVHWRSF